MTKKKKKREISRPSRGVASTRSRGESGWKRWRWRRGRGGNFSRLAVVVLGETGNLGGAFSRSVKRDSEAARTLRRRFHAHVMRSGADSGDALVYFGMVTLVDPRQMAEGEDRQGSGYESVGVMLVSCSFVGFCCVKIRGRW